MKDAFALERVLVLPRGGIARWLAVAVVVHAALALSFAQKQLAKRGPPPPPMDVEFVNITPLSPAPVPAEEKEQAAPAAPNAAKTAAPPPAAARAGAIVRARDDAPSNDEAVSFVSDPNGASYRSGVVAKGGTTDHGLEGATDNGRAKDAAPAQATAQPTVALTRKPVLESADACKGYFPASAESDSAVVTLRVLVQPSGEVSSATVASEVPNAQGFGSAARRCLLAQTFTPGLDEAGKPTLARSTVNVRFSR